MLSMVYNLCSHISDGTCNITYKYMMLVKDPRLPLNHFVLTMLPIILIYLLRLCNGSPDGSFVVNMDSQMECCDEQSLSVVDISGLTVGRYNDTFAYMNGVIVLLMEFNPRLMLELILHKEASGAYEVVFSHEIYSFCDEIEKGPDSDYYAYLKYIDIPDACPFPEGSYAVKDLVVDTEDMPINSNTAGHYQALLTFYLMPEDGAEKEYVCCLALKIVIETNS